MDESRSIDANNSLSSNLANRDVLIADDDLPTARAMAKILGDAGFSTTVAHTGAEALRHAKQRRFCAAVIDVHLPDLSGLVLTISLRERLGPRAPILVVSGDTSMETINSLHHVGATHFFAKPMSPAFLIERLKKCLEERADEA